ncbi:MAG: LytR/AlgR family response regulator transcription factor [Lachnospiraceae bacterium]
MIRIAIVEDETEHVQILYDYLKRYEKENSITFHIQTFSDGLHIVSDYAASFDIILLDIQMKHMDGMQTAEKIRKLDENVAFIFITSTIQFAVQGYLVDALGYVLKPVPYLAFSQIIGKAVKQALQKQKKYYLRIEREGGYLRLETASIYYIESQRHSIIVHSTQGDFLTAGPLKRVEEQLREHGFSKCHNAYLINLLHVNGIQNNTVLLSNAESLPVSRARKKLFMEDLTDYIGGIKR